MSSDEDIIVRGQIKGSNELLPGILHRIRYSRSIVRGQIKGSNELLP